MEKKDNQTTFFVIMLNLSEYAGSKIPISVGYPLSRNIRKAPEKLFTIVLPDFFNSFEWDNISYIERVSFITLLLLVLILSVFIVIKGLKKLNITEEEWVLITIVVSIVLTIAALTFTTVESSKRYFVLVFFAIAFGIAMVWKRNSGIVKSVLVLMMLVILVGNYRTIYDPMIIDKSFINSEYVQVGEYLIQEGYENAYTDFDHANTMTVANDGKIRVAAVASVSNMEICKWMSSKKWYVPNVSKESKTAYIISDYNMEEFEAFFKEHQDTIEFKTKIGRFSIYGSDYNYSKLTD